MIFVDPQYFYFFYFSSISISRKINLFLKQFSNHLMQGAESRQNNLVDCNINVTNERISCLGCNIRFIKIRTLIFLPSSRNQQKSCSYLLCSTVFSLVFREDEIYLLFLQFEKQCKKYSSIPHPSFHWKSYFENRRANFLLRCQKSLR